MQHPLDNPIWNALGTGNAALAQGTELVRVLPRDVGAFAGLADYSPQAWADLAALTPPTGPTVLFTAEPVELPAGWQMRLHRELLQLVYPLSTVPVEAELPPVPLQEAHVPAMLALTALTNPGPFLPRTIAFGEYYGIFRDGELAAMAGQRLQPAPYVEISAVCTHPAHLGHGYARQLVQHQIGRILAVGRIPFLHVYEDNVPAYPLYLRLGFELRKRLYVSVIERQEL